MGTTIDSDAAFDKFYERHWKYVYRLCLTYIKSEAEAEDCTEDVFVKVLKGEFILNYALHCREIIFRFK
ncbi:MAG: sigma factor [Firmicutes bacterium]|nr:sigma factor [Bacillota bacterium]